MKTSLLEEIDSISTLHVLKRDDIDAILEEIGRKILICLKIDRVSVWLFDEQRTALVSIGEVEAQSRNFEKGKILRLKSCPSYFHALFKDKILVISDVKRSPLTKELNEHYNIPLDIASLLDVPLRISGETIGVICFEQKSQTRIFMPDEITFAQSVAQVCASALEARQRRAVQHELERSLTEKNTILNELHHRLKNNYAIIGSHVRNRSKLTKDSELQALGRILENRIYDLAGIQEILQQSTSEVGINCSYFLLRLSEIHKEWDHFMTFELEHSKDHIQSKTALYLGGILLEIADCFPKVLHHSPDISLKIQLKKFSDIFSIEFSTHRPLNELVPANQLTHHLQYIQDLCEESEISQTCNLNLPVFLKLFFSKEF